MRADALRNQRRLLDAAIDEILELGGQPRLDAVARRAGVGIGTLYRRYPDRESLLRAAAVHVLDQAIAAAEGALAEAACGHEALRSYVFAAFDRGIGALNLIYPLLDNPDWSSQRRRITRLLKAILDRGKQDGTVRSDLELADIVMPIIRFSRPLAMGLPADNERALARRQLGLYVDGLAGASP